MAKAGGVARCVEENVGGVTRCVEESRVAEHSMVRLCRSIAERGVAAGTYPSVVSKRVAWRMEYLRGALVELEES